MDSRPTSMKAVYTVIERPGSPKPFWLRIGAAFTNRDGSLTVRLSALPMNGALQIRDIEPRPAEAQQTTATQTDKPPLF